MDQILSIFNELIGRLIIDLDKPGREHVIKTILYINDQYYKIFGYCQNTKYIERMRNMELDDYVRALDSFIMRVIDKIEKYANEHEVSYPSDTIMEKAKSIRMLTGWTLPRDIRRVTK